MGEEGISHNWQIAHWVNENKALNCESIPIQPSGALRPVSNLRIHPNWCQATVSIHSQASKKSPVLCSNLKWEYGFLKLIKHLEGN